MFVKYGFFAPCTVQERVNGDPLDHYPAHNARHRRHRWPEIEEDREEKEEARERERESHKAESWAVALDNAVLELLRY